MKIKGKLLKIFGKFFRLTHYISNLFYCFAEGYKTVYSNLGDIVMGQPLDDIEEIQNEINKELEGLGMDITSEASTESSEEDAALAPTLDDDSLKELEMGIGQVTASDTQKKIADELEQALNGDAEDEIVDLSAQVDDALGDIESMMETQEIEEEVSAAMPEEAPEETPESMVVEEETPVAEDVKAFDESELDEIMSEIDDMDEAFETPDENVLALKASSRDSNKDMCFQASGELDANIAFTVNGREISFKVDRTGHFEFRMDDLVVGLDDEQQVVVNLGGGMKLVAPLDVSQKSDKKKSA